MLKMVKEMAGFRDSFSMEGIIPLKSGYDTNNLAILTSDKAMYNAIQVHEHKLS